LFLVAFAAFEISLIDDTPPDVSIEFLHYTSRRTARFRLTNASNEPTTFVGHGPNEPFYEISLHLDDGWVPHSSDRVGKSAGFHTVRPSEFAEFEVPVINRTTNWKLAVLCHRGAPRFLRLPDWLGWIPYRVYDWARKRPKESTYVWSRVIPPFQPAKKPSPPAAAGAKDK
jgi:hypothetical protein